MEEKPGYSLNHSFLSAVSANSYELCLEWDGGRGRSASWGRSSPQQVVSAHPHTPCGADSYQERNLPEASQSSSARLHNHSLAEKCPGKRHAVGRKLENKCELGSRKGSAGWLQVGWSLPGLSAGAIRPPLCCWGEPSGLKRTSETPETRQSQDGINGRNLAHKSPVGGWQLWAQLVTVPWVVGHQAALFPWSPAGGLSGHPALDQLLCQFLSLGPLHHNGKFANLPPNQSGLGVPVFQKVLLPKGKGENKVMPFYPCLSAATQVLSG